MGHGIGLIGLDRTGPIESFVPPIAFAILFGLSMDYEVFLMSRIREEHIHGKNTRDSGQRRRRRDRPGRVRRRDHHVGGVHRLPADAGSHQQGVRPAARGGHPHGRADHAAHRRARAAQLLGEKSWYMPRWLDKILPEHHDRAADRATAGRGCRRPRDRRPRPELAAGVARLRRAPPPLSVLVVQGAPEPGAEEATSQTASAANAAASEMSALRSSDATMGAAAGSR